MRVEKTTRQFARKFGTTTKGEAGKAMRENAAKVEADSEARPDKIDAQVDSRGYEGFCNLLTSIATCIQKLVSRIRPTQKTFTERRNSP